MVLFYSLSPLTFLFQYKESGAFTVLVDNYVKEEEGTGIVHQAPYFGAVSSINLASVLMRSKCHWPLSCVCVCVSQKDVSHCCPDCGDTSPKRENLHLQFLFILSRFLKMVG